MTALGDEFRATARWLERHPFSGCCLALKNGCKPEWSLYLPAEALLRELYQPQPPAEGLGDHSEGYWWAAPLRGGPNPDRRARLIAIDLAALIADEGEWHRAWLKEHTAPKEVEHGGDGARAAGAASGC
jgi:hypothetical protein